MNNDKDWDQLTDEEKQHAEAIEADQIGVNGLMRDEKGEVPDGYKLAVIDENGNILDSIDIGGYDLSKPMAQANLIAEIRGIYE